jgi:tetratricopeptide (TPR) repeat protein
MAAKYFRLLLADKPDEPDYYMYLANSLAIMREFSEANDILKKGLERFGPSAEVYVNIGVNYINLDNYPEAEKYIRKALDISPGHIPTLINLANVLSSQNSREKKLEALEIYKGARDLTPEAFKVDSLIEVLQTELDLY